MMTSLYSGVSGLQMHQMKMGVIGNNIANVNTVGFKAGRMTFQELLSQSLRYADLPRGGRGGINPVQLGMGVGLGTIDVNHTEGSLQSTGMNTDLAILGNGYFILREGEDQYFSRAGALGLDTDGSIINNSNGFRVQGWNADWEGNINSNAPVGDLRIRIDDLIPSKASSEIDYIGNLNAAAPQGGSVTEEMVIYDSQGKRHIVNMNFEKKTFVDGTDNNLKGWVKQYKGIDDVVLNFKDPSRSSQPLTIDYTVRDGVVTFDVTLATDSKGEIISTIQEVHDAIQNTEVEVDVASTRINTVYEAKDAIYNLNLGSAKGGTYTLTVDGQTTEAISHNANASTVQAALESLSGITIGDVRVTGDAGGPFVINVINQPANITFDDVDLIGDPQADMAVTVADTEYELHLGNADGGTFTLTVNGDSTGPIHYNATAEEIETALLDIIDPGVVTVTGEGTVGDPFVITFDDETPDFDFNDTNLFDSVVTVAMDLEQEGQNAVERLTLTNAKGGLFTLNYFGQTTDPLDARASAEEVQAAIESLMGVGRGNVLVTGDDGGPYTIEFTGRQLHGLLSVPREVTAHDAEYRIDLAGANDGTFTLAVNGEETYALDYDANAIDVYEALIQLDGVGEEDVEVYGRGTAENPFVITFRGELFQQSVNMAFKADDDFNATTTTAGMASKIFSLDLDGATDGGFALTVDGNSTGNLDPSITAVELRERLELLVGEDNVRVTGEVGGPFTIYFKDTKNMVFEETVNLEGATKPGLIAGNHSPILEGTIAMGSEVVGLDVMDGSRLVDASSTVLKEIINRWIVTAEGPEGLRMTDQYGEGTDHWVIRFDEDGRYLRDNIGNFTFRPEAADRVTIEPIFNEMTQYAADFDVNAIRTDGYTTGSLDSFTIDKSGVIIGIYSNGLSQELGQIALAHFSNPEGLNKEADTLFSSTSNSGLPQIGVPGVGGRGVLSPGDLEMSNVDLSDQFTEMITTQRGFQANSRTIMTTDQILQELVNLIR